MKKLISSIIAGAVLMTSIPATARDHRWGVDNNRHSPYHGRSERHGHHRGGVSTGEAVAIGIGALILGAAISSNKNRTREPEVQEYYTPPVRQPQYVCQDVVKYDYYGNPYVAARNCWYQ